MASTREGSQALGLAFLIAIVCGMLDGTGLTTMLLFFAFWFAAVPAWHAWVSCLIFKDTLSRVCCTLVFVCAGGAVFALM
jgi:hypothetical protein